MATVYNDPVLRDTPPAFPTTGVHFLRIKHVTQAAYAAGDSIKLTYLPKGASIIPELCSAFSDSSSDPGNANMTVSMVVTDDTTSKTIIPATTLDAVSTRIVPTTATITALTFFKTSSNAFYVTSAIGTAAAISGRNLYYVVAYTMDGGRSEVTT